jgi:hypothetical protein
MLATQTTTETTKMPTTNGKADTKRSHSKKAASANPRPKKAAADTPAAKSAVQPRPAGAASRAAKANLQPPARMAARGIDAPALARPLFEALPPGGTTWSLEKGVAWLEAVAGVVKFACDFSGTLTVKGTAAA